MNDKVCVYLRVCVCLFCGFERRSTRDRVDVQCGEGRKRDDGSQREGGTDTEY